MNKRQTSVSFSKETLDKLDSLQALNKSASRNKIIENAINFYFAYKTGEINQDYICSVYGKKVEGIIGNNTDRLSRLLFKETVEINLLTRLVASHFEIDKNTYDKMRLTAVNDSKSTKGIISIYDAQS
ncbi:MAG: hypothetical protein J1E56_05540 [Ruminococcus sp.]|nr:hypothetical protein [Ruminococcus sp.]